jgi:hypothetical protein
MKLILFLTFFIQIFSFKSHFRKFKNFNLYSNKDTNEHLPKIINNDYFNEMIEKMDKFKIQSLNGTIPRSPCTEDEIVEDSFEGYLRNHFNIIKNEENKINFDEFLSWRKQIGTLLTTEEIFIIYNEVIEEETLCDLMNFILVNRVIDEVDGADF